MSNKELPINSEEWLIAPRGAGIWGQLREFIKYRRLLRYFATQAVSKTYQRTYLGSLWLFIRPLFPVLIGLLIFQNLVGQQVSGVPYLIFYLSGLCVWQLFAQALSWVTRSLETNRKLLKKLYFPKLILPLAFISPAVVEFFIQLTLLLLVAIYYLISAGTWHLEISWIGALYLCTALFLALGLALGIGLWTSVMAIDARDIRYLIGYILGFWQYLTPIFYPITSIPPGYRWLLQINPMACASDLFRAGLIGSSAVPGIDVVVAAGIVIVIFTSGLWFFFQYDRILADHV